MSPYWDNRHEVPVFEHSSIESSTISTAYASRNIVVAAGTPEDQLNIDSLFIPNKSDTMIVAFHGALVRKDVELPRFEWLGTLRSRPENLLFIADTSLSLHPELTLGWYIGTEEDDLTVKLARYIRHIQELLGIKRVILMGSSGGGYAALAAATLLQDSCAIAFSPQTDVFDFTPGHTKNLMKYVFPKYQTPEELAERWPERFSLVERYRASESVNRFIYFQNLGDIDHVVKHKKPFAESLGVRLPNGRTFDQSGRFISVDHGAGHVRPPTAELPKLLSEARQMLDTPVKERLRSACLEGGVLQHSFVRSPHPAFRRVPPESNSYYYGRPYPLPPESPNLKYTDDGVPLRVLEDGAYDHPVLQAQFLMKLINNYRLDPSHALMSRMDSVFERLMSQAVEAGDASYLPYLFPWHQGKLQGPWYSAMAQGQALGAVVRLYEVAPNPKYLSFADSLFRSFLKLREGSEPWTVDIDSDGYLWFEEYPYEDHGMGVMNGHLFAVWGVYDYWRITDNNLALELASSALMTTKRYVHSYRNPGWCSHYDKTELLLIRNYHTTHINQLEMTYNLTGDAFFLNAADTFEADFPGYQGGGDVYCAAGGHLLIKTDHDVVPTQVARTEQIMLDEAAAFSFSRRTKIEMEPGVWLLISSGPHSGWWIKEEAKRVFPKGCFDKHVYKQPRKALFTPGRYSSHGFNEFGSPIDHVQTDIEAPLSVEVTAKALWRGEWYFQLQTEVFRNRWIQCNTNGLYV